MSVADGALPEPPLTAVEERLLDLLPQDASQSGTIWAAMARGLEIELGLQPREVGAIGVNERGVAANRLLSPGLIRQYPTAKVYFVVVSDYGLLQVLGDLARELNEKTRHLRTVALLAPPPHGGGAHRVRRLYEIEGLGIAQTLRQHFPAATVTALPLVPLASAFTPVSDGLAPAATDTPALESAARPAPLSYAGLSHAWDVHLEGLGLQYDADTRRDFLACLLSSQFVLFAGPSGTGKSSAARAAMSFFCVPERTGRIDVRRQWTGPEDLVGYRSAFNDSYVFTQDTDTLLRLHRAGAVPALLLEEINLSVVEAYLAPVVHGFSGLATHYLDWTLYRAPAQPEHGGDEGRLSIGPWPRILGTLNVDATAGAPARKVVGRAATILLTADQTPDLETAWEHLAGGGTASGGGAAGVGFIGDPRWPLQHLQQRGAGESLRTALTTEMESLGKHEVTPPSARAARQCLLYLAAATVVAESSMQRLPDDREVAAMARTALLHHVLPALSDDEFQRVVDHYVDPDGDSLLDQRLTRLHGAGSGPDLGLPRDYWSQLS